MKMVYYFVFSFLLLFNFVSFASAQYYGGGFWYGTEQVIDSVVMNLEPLFRALLGGYDWSGYLLFEKVLLFILISTIIGLILQKLPVFENIKSKKILRLISVIISLLAIRNLNYIWIGTILVQYQVLFIAIAGVLPFIIYWYFVESIGKENNWVRKAAWVFYAIIYFGLWLTTELATYNEVYLWTALIALVYAFFLDAYVHQWMEEQKLKKQFTRHTWHQIAELNERIAKLNKQIAEGTHPKPSDAQREIIELIRHRNTYMNNSKMS